MLASDTSIVAQGALAQHLQSCTICKIDNGWWGLEKGSHTWLLGAQTIFCKTIFFNFSTRSMKNGCDGEKM